MDKLLFIVNPGAGDGKYLHELARAAALSARAECVFVAFDDLSRDQTWLSAHSAAIVFGGDGTLNRWLPALAKAGVATAVYPAGTVNNLAHELALQRDWGQLEALIRERRVRRSELVSVNGVPFASYGTLGVGAENSRYMHATRTSMRTLRLLFPMLQTPIFACRTILWSDDYLKHVRLRLRGTQRELVTPGIYVTNQAKLNKYIDLDWEPARHPGEFLVVVLKHRGRRRLLQTCLRLYSQRSIRAVADDVEVHRCSELSIESLDGTPLSFFGDGEPLVSAPALELRLAQNPLWVISGRHHEAALDLAPSHQDSVQA